MKLQVSCSKCWGQVTLKKVKKSEDMFEGECPTCMVTLYGRVRK